MQKKLDNAFGNGYSDITLQISPGTYFFSENHLILSGKDYPETDLSIIGEGVIITGRGNEADNGPTRSFLSPQCALMSGSSGIDCWSRSFNSESPVETVDSSRNLFRIKSTSSEVQKAMQKGVAYILVTSWYRSFICSVQKYHRGYIYFQAKESGELNGDWSYGNKLPRFKLYEPPKDLQDIHICTAGRFIACFGSRFRSFTLSGISFAGNMDNGHPLIDVANLVTEKASISNCSFSWIHSRVASIYYTTGLSITRCCFKDCSKGGIIAAFSTRAEISDNVFERMGKDMNNDFCIECYGEDYKITGNSIKNFSYGGIGIGAWFESKEPIISSGIVKDNELWMEADYLTHPEDHCLMDSGAIYASSQNEDTEICFNYVHDIDGIKDNRGIFLDDGARNISIFRNTILNISNSFCIDSRRCPKPESKIGPTNVNNRIYDNILDGPIRFEGRESNDNCMKQGNILIRIQGKKPGKSTIKHISTISEDITATSLKEAQAILSKKGI